MLLFAGVESTRNLPADTSTFTIDGLQSDSAYTVFVSPMIGTREGSRANIVIRTGPSQSKTGPTAASVFPSGNLLNTFTDCGFVFVFFRGRSVCRDCDLSPSAADAGGSGPVDLGWCSRGNGLSSVLEENRRSAFRQLERS